MTTQEWEDYLHSKLTRSDTPEYMHAAVIDYIVRGVPPGDFIEAVICNDLKEATIRADSNNLAALVQWVRFFYNYAPSDCWGSKARMQGYLLKKRKERQLQEQHR